VLVFGAHEIADGPHEVDAPVSDDRRFFDLCPGMLATATIDGRLLEVNPAFTAILGQSSDELTGRPYVDFVHPDDVASMEESAAKVAGGTPVIGFEIRHRCADESYRWVRWSARLDAATDTVFCSASDATERRVQEGVVDTLVLELQRSNADLGQFAYVASHDLSEPLRMVSSYVQLLADRYEGKLDADADEFIRFAVDGASRMKILIDDLLAYSRAARVGPVHRHVNCAAVVQDVLNDLSAMVSEAGARVTVGAMPSFDSDPGLLAQVFQNLVANALKFTSPGVRPLVTVSAERAGASWQFAVEDNGIGIAENHKERIFLMFKRLHGRYEYPGTGIGLSLCERIVGRLGGRLWVESEPGKGSTFFFTVPDADTALNPAA
jgi:PAS domain S-box-containing protein